MSNDEVFMKEAYRQAKISYEQGGIPVGAVLVKEGKIISSGHNQRVQMSDPIAHGEIDCIRKAGRIGNYRNCTLYTTLSPCMMCAGTIVQFGIPHVVIGEDSNYKGNIGFLRSHGVEVKLMHDEACILLMKSFIAEKPELWWEDIGK